MPLEIVYIDDEPDLCQTFADNFGWLDGVALRTFVDPELALKSIDVAPPNLVFIDFRLPNTTGVAVARRINASIPMAIVSGDLTIKLEAPFVRIFPKPFNFTELEAFILGFLTAEKQP